MVESSNIQYVKMAYLGKGRANVAFSGYLRRKYVVSMGWTGSVHPDDVKKLLRTNKFEELEIVEQKPVVVTETKTEAVELPAFDGEITAGAQALADENGIDCRTVTGTGKNGKITVKDIRGLL